jgi:hypothetical protein
MTFVPCLNTALIEFRMLYDRQNVENTIWVQKSSAWTAPTLALAAENALGWWNGSFAILASNSLSLREVVATDMTTATSGQTALDGEGAVGSDTGQGMPGNVSLAVSFRTALRGRSFRGRNYIVGIPRGFVEEESTASEDYVASAIAAYSALISGTFESGQAWVVASRFSGVDPTTKKPIPRAAGVMTPITNVVIVDDTTDSMRRRLPGRGA